MNKITSVAETRLTRKNLTYITLYVVVILFSSTASAGRWGSWEEYCNLRNELEGKNRDCSQMVVTGTSSFSHWAGDVVEVYCCESDAPSMLKVQITWVTDKSPYKCGAIVKMRPDEIRNFTHRSLAMRRCN